MYEELCIFQRKNSEKIHTKFLIYWIQLREKIPVQPKSVDECDILFEGDGFYQFASDFNECSWKTVAIWQNMEMSLKLWLAVIGFDEHFGTLTKYKNECKVMFGGDYFDQFSSKMPIWRIIHQKLCITTKFWFCQRK